MTATTPAPHRLLRTSRIEGLVLRDHAFQVPVAHPGLAGTPEVGGTLELFGREVLDPARAKDTQPWLVFLQGGPGFGAPRPLERNGWIRRATEDFRVLLLDQRGTGRSTPVSAQSLARLGGPEEVARHLACFRSDAIVEDCEAVRCALLGTEERWTVLGQSYGGFCATRYLSARPGGLAAVLLTGGLPPLRARAEEVYQHTYPLVQERCDRYFERFPDDERLVRAVLDRLEAGDVVLPTGGPLSPRGLQLLGHGLGFSDGAAQLHYLFEDAWVPGREGEELSYAFLRGYENHVHFDTNPIYAILHEACYTQGRASRWAAERVRAEYPVFDAAHGRPYLTGEMIYPWMFTEIPALRPLRDAAEVLAEKEDWPVLYDRDALARNTVPVAAAVYYDDMYVVRELSLETARAIRGARTWITNEYEHNGLRADGERVLGRLLDLVR